MVKFGANLAGFNFVNCFSRSLDNVLIGRRWGEFALGLYGNAYRLVMAPILQISVPFSKVAIPALSRLQNEPNKYRAYYRKAVMLLASVGMPLVVLLFVASKETILVFLGPKWVKAVPIFQVLAPAAFFGTFNMATGWVYTSLAHTHRQFRWGILTSIITVTAFFIAIPHGAIAVGAAFSIVYCGLTMGYPGFAYCFRGTPLRVADMSAAIWRPATASLSAGALLYPCLHVLHGHGPVVVTLALASILYAIAYVAVWIILPGGKDFIRNVFLMAGHLRPKGKRSTVAAVATTQSVREPLTA
jgi:O-antigen/teichoic acid export membrane protein